MHQFRAGEKFYDLLINSLIQIKSQKIKKLNARIDQTLSRRILINSGDAPVQWLVLTVHVSVPVGCVVGVKHVISDWLMSSSSCHKEAVKFDSSGLEFKWKCLKSLVMMEKKKKICIKIFFQ